jgi:hypothetical protein
MGKKRENDWFLGRKTKILVFFDIIRLYRTGFALYNNRRCIHGLQTEK